MKKNILCLILASLLMGTLAACNDSAEQDTQSADTSGTAQINEGGTETTPVSNFEAAKAFVGETAFDGKTFRILSPDPGSHMYNWTGTEENELFYDGSADDILSEAVYRRNMQTEEALGVTIEPVWGGSMWDIDTTVKNNNAAGETEAYQAVLTRLDFGLNLAMGGNYLNFYGVESMNMKNAWWDNTIVDTFTLFGDKLYVLSGDINYYDDYAVQAMLFNKNMADKLNIETPYQLVRDGKWTMDKLAEYAALASSDTNGDGLWEVGTDVFGFGDNYDVVPHLIFCYDQRMSENDENGAPVIVEPNDANIAALEKIHSFITQSQVVTYAGSENAAIFTNDQLLFYAEMIGILPTFRDMESDFGVLPMPKGDESMDGYKAYVSNGWTTCYVIPSSFTYEQAAEMGVVLEVMSAASKDLVTPALYDQLFEAKFIRDLESKEMLEYVFASKVYDWAGDLAWATSLRTVYQNVAGNSASYFTSGMAAVKKLVTKSLNDMCNDFSTLDGGPAYVPSTGVSSGEDGAAVLGLGSHIEAEDYTDKNGSVQAEMLADGSVGMNLGWVVVGDYVYYENIDLTGVNKIHGRYGGMGGTLEFRLDAPDGELIATQPQINTGSWSAYDEFTAGLTAAVEGVHTLYIVFTENSTNVDWFELTYGIGAGDKVEAEDYTDKNGSVQAEMIADGSVGMNLGWVVVGDYVYYEGIDFTGVTKINGRYGGMGGTLEFRLDAPDGELIATQPQINTGDWATYAEYSADLTAAVAGVHTLYIVFTENSTNVDWFAFE